MKTRASVCRRKVRYASDVEAGARFGRIGVIGAGGFI